MRDLNNKRKYRYEYPTCCLCGKVYDKDDEYTKEYVIRGRGKNKNIDYFHTSCFQKQTIGAMKKG